MIFTNSIDTFLTTSIAKTIKIAPWYLVKPSMCFLSQGRRLQWRICLDFHCWNNFLISTSRRTEQSIRSEQSQLHSSTAARYAAWLSLRALEPLFFDSWSVDIGTFLNKQLHPIFPPFPGSKKQRVDGWRKELAAAEELVSSSPCFPFFCSM